MTSKVAPNPTSTATSINDSTSTTKGTAYENPDPPLPLTAKNPDERTSAERSFEGTPIAEDRGTILSPNSERRRRESARKNDVRVEEALKKAGGKWVDADSVREKNGIAVVERSVVDYRPVEVKPTDHIKYTKSKVRMMVVVLKGKEEERTC